MSPGGIRTRLQADPTTKQCLPGSVCVGSAVVA